MAEIDSQSTEEAVATDAVAAEAGARAATATATASVDSQDRDPAYHLPPFTRNLLRVEVPVMVTLARKRQPIQSILEIVPGSLIQFNKSCDEMLDLEINGHPAAVGECVKVGDKFGLRITSMTVPVEKVVALKSKAAQA
jgi:flagellar motor switch protein FliN/FliY